MQVLITGSLGQLGRTLQELKPAEAEIRAVDVEQLDITDAEAVRRLVGQSRPDLIINAAAYTAVDRAEKEMELAYRINRDGIANLAAAAAATGARVFHVSTDYVFDGQGHSPYLPDSPTAPLGVYGQSKLDGENELRRLLPNRSVIIRTAWLYSVHGNNFMKTMLRLMAERESLNVVADQIGTPTGANSLVRTLWGLAANPEALGVYHHTDDGVASWYDFAQAIREEGEAAGLLKPTAAKVCPIRTEEYPTPARRPAYSVLDKRAVRQASGVAGMHWRVNLRTIIKDYQNLTTAGKLA